MTDSWRLKLGRAEHHLKDIESRLSEFIGPEPYAGRVRIERSNRRRQPWDYILEMTLGEDPEMPILIGDFLFNARSALDHIAVASVPARRKGQASFPILVEDIWGPAEGGRAQEFARLRAVWEQTTKGMTKEVLAVVKGAQPYVDAAQSGNRAEWYALAILSAFQNADKHRELTVVAHGIREPRGVIHYRGLTEELTFPDFASDQVLSNGAVFLRSEDKMNVEVQGLMNVAMARRPKGAHHELPGALHAIVANVQTILTDVETVLP